MRLKPYRCTAGKLSIGIGRNLDDVGISEDEAHFLLDNDINRVIVALASALPWFVEMDEVRQRVLVDMGFNLGVPGLLKFKNTLAAVERKDYEAAAKGMLASKWARQVKGRAETLARWMRSGSDL